MKKYLGYTLTVLVAAFTMVGCGKNSDGGQPAAVQNTVNPYGYPLCSTCVGGQSQSTTASSSNQQLGEGIQIQMYTQGSNYLYGQGSTAQIQGVLVVGQYAQNCGLPPGQYQIQPTQIQMQGNAVAPFSFYASGPVQAMVQVSRMYFTTPTNFQVNGQMQGQYGQPWHNHLLLIFTGGARRLSVQAPPTFLN